MTDLNHVVLIGRLTRDLGTDERSFAYTQILLISLTASMK